MIIRIVKMTFKPETVVDFEHVFHQSAEQIRAFPGNKGLQLLQSEEDRTIFFTYSMWEHEEALQAYRTSELFQSTWAKTKVLFGGKPEAWSTTCRWTGI